MDVADFRALAVMVHHGFPVFRSRKVRHLAVHAHVYAVNWLTLVGAAILDQSLDELQLLVVNDPVLRVVGHVPHVRLQAPFFHGLAKPMDARERDADFHGLDGAVAGDVLLLRSVLAPELVVRPVRHSVGAEMDELQGRRMPERAMPGAHETMLHAVVLLAGNAVFQALIS